MKAINFVSVLSMRASYDDVLEMQQKCEEFTKEFRGFAGDVIVNNIELYYAETIEQKIECNKSATFYRIAKIMDSQLNCLTAEFGSDMLDSIALLRRYCRSPHNNFSCYRLETINGETKIRWADRLSQMKLRDGKIMYMTAEDFICLAEKGDTKEFYEILKDNTLLVSGNTKRPINSHVFVMEKRSEFR